MLAGAPFSLPAHRLAFAVQVELLNDSEIPVRALVD